MYCNGMGLLALASVWQRKTALQPVQVPLYVAPDLPGGSSMVEPVLPAGT